MSKSRNVIELKNEGFEETDTPCPACGGTLMFREVNFWMDGDELFETVYVCPICDYSTVVYDD